MKHVLNFSIFTGILPISFSGIIFSNIKNFVDEKINTDDEHIYSNNKVLRHKDQNNKKLFVSLRSNPMNNFVSLTTTKVGNGNIKEQFIYALCDTATSQDGIKYGKNSGVAKLDYEGNIVALWTLPKTGWGQENEYIYTTNIVFGDTEETVYVLCGISNPAAALNSVYGEAVVPTKINYDASADSQDPSMAYFYRNNLLSYRVFQRDNTNKYKVNITNYSFANYPKINVYKLKANDLKETTKYDFEFPPAATGKLNDPAIAFNEYDKTIIAGFGGGQHLNYWSTNSTWITNYKTKSDQSISLMNSSFFHYLQFGQTFDYVGNNQFMMVPTYVGIDPNLGGLYSLVNEGMTRSLASFSSYPSLYNVLYKYKGKPSVDIGTKTVDFSQDPATSTQYQYLNGLGRKVDVTSDSEFTLKKSVINLILLSIGYFLPDHEWILNKYGIDMEKVVAAKAAPGYLLNTYGIVCFSPLESEIINKYKLYVFNKDNFFGVPTSQFIIRNMFINVDVYGKKRYLFFLSSDFYDGGTFYPDFYNGSAREVLLYGIKNPSGDLRQQGFTWDEFVDTYDTIQNSQNNAIHRNINLTGVNANSYDWTNHNGDNQRYYDNLNSILTVKNYSNNSYPLGWYADHGFLIPYYSEINGIVTVVEGQRGKQFAMFPSYSGSKYISYGGKALISDPIWANKLVVIGSTDNFSEHVKRNYSKSYEYGGSSKYANTAESYNKISTLFLLPGNKGFGYLTYDNQLKMCFLNFKNLHDQLKSDHFKSLLSNKNELSIFSSVVPVGKMLFTSTLNNDNIISNGHFYINNSVVDNNTTMWIIIGVCSAAAIIIVLGLGIGISMRKNAKIQLAVAKLANKKIDMLSTTVAKSFKKLAENTNTLSKNQPKVLYSIVFNKAIWSSPIMLKLLPKPQNKPTEEAKIITKLTNQQQKASKNLSSISSKSTRDLTKASK